MRILYIDLKVNNPCEDYSVNPKGYGGGAVFARYAKESLNKDGNRFVLAASEDCFKNLGNNDNKLACLPIPDQILFDIQRGRPLADALPNDTSPFDLVIHHHDCLTINMAGLSCPLVHWALMGDGRANHPNTPYSLLYLKHETAVYGKTFHVNLGKPILPFVRTDKKDYIFQCTRHDEHTNTIEVAKFCSENRIQGIFAGPIFHNYDLMKYIDNTYTHYLGLISEEDKLKYLREARLSTLLFKWDCPFNQSAIEALSCGTPLLVNPRGFLRELVKDGYNGMVHDGDFVMAWSRAKDISQKDCWDSVQPYSETNMVGSFMTAFKEILKDWKK